MFDFWSILDWLFYGAVRYVLLWVPFVTPPRVDRGIPSLWWYYNSWNDWDHKDDNNGGPDERWCQAWFRMALGGFELLVLQEAKPYVDEAKNWLRGIIGGIKSGFASLGDWTNWLQVAVGAAVPWWTPNLAAGVDRLRGWFPDAIYNGWLAWNDIWTSIKADVRNWARNEYDRARDFAYQARDWVSGVGDGLRLWRDKVAGWIDNFRANPYGFITGVLGSGWSWLLGFYPRARETVIGWLGPDWVRLTNFARDCSVFYYNLWSLGWRTLSDFIADPVGFVGDRLEAYLLKKW